MGVIGCLGVSHGVHCLVVAVVASPSAPDEEEGKDRAERGGGGGGVGAKDDERASCKVEVTAAHVGAMQALSYVAKGKPNRRFVLVTPDGTCGAVVETKRTSFVYRTPPPSSSSSSPNAPAASAASASPASSGLHQILDLSTACAAAASGGNVRSLVRIRSIGPFMGSFSGPSVHLYVYLLWCLFAST